MVVEVISPSDRWPKVLAKAVEYLETGVTVVLILDGEPPSARLFQADGTTREFGPDDGLAIPDLLPGFAVAVRRFFE